MKRVVITGMGAITPIGNTIASFTNNLLNGTGGVAGITRFDAAKFKTRFAAEVKDFDPLQYMDKIEARKTDLHSQFALAAASAAIAEAMPNQHNINLNRVGVILGSANGGAASYEQQIMAYAKGDGVPRYNPFFISMMMANAAPGHISMRYGFSGMNYTSIAACAASSIAIIDAVNQIRMNKADMMITGGTEACITDACVGGFLAMKALSSENATPEKASRPFDTARDGFAVGEGAVLFVIESEEHALQRGANIIAEITGTGITSDAHHIAAPHPEGTGAANAIQLALDEAGISPQEIDYISAHATSTIVGDLAEINAIRRIFGDAPHHLKISSVKSAVGHLLGASGALGLLAGVIAIQTQQIPPTINTTHIDARIPATLPIVTGVSIPHAVTTALCNSFGFGGHNAIIICKKYP
jgi:3-oxoacyl-[acyl-carrier-protein] synthase II